MNSSNRSKIIFVVSLLIIMGGACRFWDNSDSPNNSDSPIADVQTNVPFETKEPETFQAEIVVSNYIGDKKTKRKYFVAKKEDKNLIIFDYESKRETVNLQTDRDTLYLINRKQKSFRKLTRGKARENQNELENFLTTKMLSEKIGAEFENLGVTNDLTKYRVTLAESKKTEIYIFIDEELKIPVKQEFYSIKDGKQILNYVIEVKDLKTDVNDNLFDLPTDYSEKESES